MIIHSSVIHLDIVMVVHITVGMVLIIITMETDVIKTGILIEVSMVETPICHQELLLDLQGRLHLLILLSLFTHHQLGHLVATLDSMVCCINVKNSRLFL